MSEGDDPLERERLRPSLFAQAHSEVEALLGSHPPVVVTAPAVLVGRGAEADGAGKRKNAG